MFLLGINVLLQISVTNSKTKEEWKGKKLERDFAGHPAVVPEALMEEFMLQITYLLLHSPEKINCLHLPLGI